MNKKYILKKNYEIEKLIKKKQSVGNQYYAIYYNETTNQMPKIAISISKHLGNAVIRNHEKRIIREIIRKMLFYINNLDMLIVIKRNSTQLNYLEKQEQLERLIRFINKKRRQK